MRPRYYQLNTSSLLVSTKTTKASFSSRQTGQNAVRASTIVMIAFAVVFGLLAVFIAQAWLNNQAEHAGEESRGEQEADGDANHRRRQAAAALRHRAQRRDAARKCRGRRSAAERRLHQDQRRVARRHAAWCSPRSSRTSRCSRSRSPAPASARRCRRWCSRA